MNKERIEEEILAISEQVSDLSAMSGLTYDEIWQKVKETFD